MTPLSEIKPGVFAPRYATLLFVLLAAPLAHAGEWIPLFDGDSLDDWTPKFTGYEAGENLHDTFRVDDGLLKVCYDDWDRFDGEFGHLFYTGPVADGDFGDCRFRVVVRFAGEQVANGPGWAFRNNGLMTLGQRPEEMELDQKFPDSLEVQLLARAESNKQRSTGNLCTPGTDVVMDGALRKKHCTESSSPTFEADEWVTVEFEFKDGVATHFVDGEPVLTYADPQLDDGTLVESGSVSIQAETAECEFKSIEVMFFDE